MHWLTTHTHYRRFILVFFVLVSVVVVGSFWRWYQLHIVKVERFYTQIELAIEGDQRLPDARLDVLGLSDDLRVDIANRLAEQMSLTNANLSEQALQRMTLSATQWLNLEDKLVDAVHEKLQGLAADRQAWRWQLNSAEQKIIAIHSDCLFLEKRDQRWQLVGIEKCTVTTTNE